MVLVGIPEPTALSAGSLVMQRRRLAGSLIGGIRETQEMLDFCAEHKVYSDVEVIPIGKINEATTGWSQKRRAYRSSSTSRVSGNRRQARRAMRVNGRPGFLHPEFHAPSVADQFLHCAFPDRFEDGFALLPADVRRKATWVTMRAGRRGWRAAPPVEVDADARIGDPSSLQALIAYTPAQPASAA
jgi:hypothetical protein